MIKNNKGFTLIELLVVIAIIGILSTLAVVALGNARVKSRDAKRVSDMRQIISANELYYNDVGFYPTAITSGNPISNGSTVYMAVIPTNPSPMNDNTCPATPYAYTSTGTPPTTYSITFCLGGATGDLGVGTNHATPAGLAR